MPPAAASSAPRSGADAFRSGTITGTLAATTDASGNAVFSTLAVDMPGTYTLRATAQSKTAPSGPFTITSAAASSLSFATQPVNASSGVDDAHRHGSGDR